MGYSPMDIITTLFRVVKTFPDNDMPEFLKLEFIRVRACCCPLLFSVDSAVTSFPSRGGCVGVAPATLLRLAHPSAFRKHSSEA